MEVKLQQITGLVEELAPVDLAADWDNVGLQVGDYNQKVGKVLVSLDINSDVFEEAISVGADLIIAHHPLIFNNIASIRYNTPLGSIIKKAVKEDISLYIAHTNYDIAPGGLNDLLAEKLGVKNTSVLNITVKENLKKLVIFVPEEALNAVKTALGEAGAGWIGNYSHCFFFQKGTGSFKPLPGTSPHTGSVGKLSSVNEYRLETVVYEKELGRVIKKMLKAHPYEEAAYDIYPLEKEGKTLGLGRVGVLQEKTTLKKYAQKVKETLGIKNIKIAGKPDAEIKKVALCSGSGKDLINSALFQGADVFVSGGITYHAGQRAKEKGLNIIDAGHYGTEKIMISGMADYLEKKINRKKLEVQVIKSRINTDPFREN